jgi:hypothetical protein
MAFLKIAGEHDKRKKHTSANRLSQHDVLAEERRKQEDKERQESLLEREKLLAEIALERKTLDEKDHELEKRDAPHLTEGEKPEPILILPETESATGRTQSQADAALLNSNPPQEKHQEQIVNEILSGELLFLESMTRISVHFKVPFLNKALLHGTEGMIYCSLLLF